MKVIEIIYISRFPGFLVPNIEEVADSFSRTCC